MAKRKQSLDDLRRAIDAIDGELIDLLNRRAALAQQIGALKRERGDAAFDPARHRQVLRRVRGRSRGPFPPDQLERVYAEIMSASLMLEAPLRIGYLGPEASFSHLAAIQEFGHGVEQRPLATIPDIFHAVESGSIDLGVVPIENSTEGIVHFTMDMFLESPLQICSELQLRVRLCLLAKGPLARVRRVYSHPQPLRQAQRWLRENLPQAQVVEVASTTRGAEMAARGRGAASVGSEIAAEKYGLAVLARGIEDDVDNTTRFLIVGRHHPGPSGADKTSIMFTLRDKPGALVEALLPFRRAGINMSNIDVRPSHRRAFDYAFFIDVEGHIDDPKVAHAIENLREHCVMVKVLGSYPKK
jgi:chorismate mutase/prephenate dehydratase